MYLSSFHQQIENTMYYNVLTQTATLLLLFTKYCSSQFDGLGSVPGQSVPPSNPFLAGTGTGGSLGNRGQQFGTSPRITSSNIADIDWSAIDRRDEENWYHLYPFGEKYLDSNNNGRPWNDQQIDLDFFYPFGGFRYNYTYIFPEGFVAFSYPDYVQPPYTFPRPNWPDEYDPAFIAAFMIDQQLMHVGDHMLSNVWYRIISRPPALIGKSNQDGNTNLQPPRGTINAATGAADRYYAGHLLRASEGRVEDPALLDRIEVDIRNAMVGARGSRFDYALIVTWERMGYGGAPKFTALNQYEHVKRWQNTYQMVLATDEDRSYVMFNYANINWTSATSAGALFGRGGKQSALVGFNAGNGTGFMELPYSAEGNSYKLVQFGSSPTAGRWAARVDELFIYGGCTNESTGTMVGHIGALPMLGGISFNISGPCFRPTDRIKLQIDELTLPCVRMSMTIARCVIPIHAIYRSGIVDAKVSIDGGQSYPFWRKSLILPPSRMRESIRLIDDPVDTNNNWMSLTPEKLLLKWNKHNITFDPNKRLNLYLYGYWEDVASHNMEPVALIGEGIENKGSYEFSPSQLDRWHMSLLDDAWKKYLGGMLQVHCPCVIDQAFADFGRFYPLVDCDAFGDSYCYAQQGASHCVISAQFMLSGAAQVCCYGPEGYLMFSDDYEWNDQYLRFYGAGVPYRAHIEGSPPFKRPPFVPGLSQFHNDQMPFEMCCKWAGHCEFYYWRRQSDGCQDYRPPTLGILFQMHPAFAYGHGHFITFDGLSYTFPGKGYFVLAKMASPYTKMQVQVRMEQPPEPIWGSAARSTIITGVVAQVNGSSKVEIYARKDHRRWKYRMDVYVDNMRVFFDMSFKRHYNFNGLMIRVPGRVVATETVEVMFTSGVGLRVNEFEGSLSVEIALPDNYNATLKHLYPGQREFQEDAAPRTRSCNDVHQTYGLLGTFNGDPDDDLTVMNGDTCAQGSRISQPPSVEELRALYTGFGMKWEADGKSVPVMFNTKRRALYNPGLFASDEGYIPAFDIWRELESDVTMFQSLIFTQEEVKLACQGNWNCQFDYVNTGRREIAMNTLNTEKKYKSTKDSAEQLLISCGPLWKGPGVLKYPPTGNYLDGITVTFQCRPDFFLHGEQQRTCVNGTWTPGWWAWCRSRSFEIFLKWMVGLTTSIIIIMIIAVIFLLCFLRRKKQKHEGDRHPEALHKIDDVAHDEHTAAGFQQRHPTPEQVPIVTPQNEQKFDQGYYTAPPPGAEHNFVQQPVFSGTMPNARYDSPPAYGNEGDAGVGHQSSF